MLPPPHLDKSTGLFPGGCTSAGGGQCSSGWAGRTPGGMSSWRLDPHTHTLQRTRAVGHGDAGAVAGRWDQINSTTFQAQRFSEVLISGIPGFWILCVPSCGPLQFQDAMGRLPFTLTLLYFQQRFVELPFYASLHLEQQK